MHKQKINCKNTSFEKEIGAQASSLNLCSDSLPAAKKARSNLAPCLFSPNYSYFFLLTTGKVSSRPTE